MTSTDAVGGTVTPSARHPSGALADVLPLTPLQEGLFFHARFDMEGQDVYLVQLTLELAGVLDPQRLRAAGQSLLDRHPNLRGAFRQRKGGRPVQVVPHTVALPWSETDLGDLTEPEREAEWHRLLDEDRERGFPLGTPPLFRMWLVRLAPDRHRLVLTQHHILLDGWSMPILIDELDALYRASGAVGPTVVPEVRPYRDYLAWLDGQNRPAARAAWRRMLADLPEPTRLAPQGAGHRACLPVQQSVEIPEHVTRGLRERCQQSAVTLNTMVQTAWAVVLSRLTGRGDVVFGQTVSGRPTDLRGSEGIIGLLINTVPIRIGVRPGEPLEQLAERVQAEQAEMLDHHHLGLADIQRTSGFHELFDTLLIFENYPAGAPPAAEEADALRIVGFGGRDATHYPVTLVAVPGDRFQLRLAYQAGLFTREWAETTLAALGMVLEQLATRPDLPSARLALPLGARPEPASADQALDTLVGAFERQVGLTPDSPAVHHGGTTLNYRELDAAANRLSGLLIEAGAVPESIIGIALPRDERLPVALLAVLKAGAAYLPLDPEYPTRRLAFMVEDARPGLVLTTVATAARLPKGTPMLVLDRPEVSDRLRSACPDRPAPTGLLPTHPAYVIYTSGSTGRSKGVVVSHGSAAALARSAAADLGPEALARVAATTSLNFDVSVFELFTPLLCGGSVELLRDALALGDRKSEEPAPSLVSTVPSVLAVLAAQGQLPVGVGTFAFCGEALPGRLVSQVRAAVPRARLVNLYGPTEATVFATAWFSESAPAVSKAADPPIGRPIAGIAVRVLDDSLQPIPFGTSGALYLSGVGLARGYLGRPALTAERFVADPFGPPGGRMYRTGDLVRQDVDGTLHFVGRTDEQVKLRGFRIELGEVEAVLGDCEEVGHCSVVLRRDRPGDPRLVAYVVPRGGRSADPAALTAALRERLPAYMVPSAFVSLTRLPLTANGKLDRKALPAPVRSAESGVGAATTTTQEIVRQLFAEVLGVARVGLDEDFFELGGHSLLATRLVGQIGEAFGIQLSIRHLFEAPTVTRFADALGEEAPDPLARILPLRSAGRSAPLFCIHPVFGLSWTYAGLLRHVGPDRPVYGLQSPGLRTGSGLPTSIAEAALECVALIRGVQPSGPYHLLGWSLGGMLAHTVACLLQRQDEEVALLALLDAYPSAAFDSPVPAERGAVFRDLLELLGHAVPPGAETLDAACFLAAVRGEGGLLSQLDEQEAEALRIVVTNNRRLAEKFSPGHFRGDLLFFTAVRDRGPDWPTAEVWRPHISGEIENHEVSCRHDDMTKPQAIARIGPVIAARLRTRNATNRGA
ncbi:amino acid adenylation domain-containing protein [Streptomyces hyaluromycini]|uniref:amino acid adenylation domain-containing protein n=1 Tax=Streptomyces hyaluromycini TaxID=1377993 RepID=UPI001FECB2ED|nr:amino acid adenylation domain-containing protein [Streptomyces hyaluromycini]